MLEVRRARWRTVVLELRLRCRLVLGDAARIAQDLNGKPAWETAAAAPYINGAILKVTEGLGWCDPLWFNTNWSAIHQVKRKIGKNWFCGAYHYLIASVDGDKQAAYFLKQLHEAAGSVRKTSGRSSISSTKATSMRPRRSSKTRRRHSRRASCRAPGVRRCSTAERDC